jgi:UDP-N-acetylmuramoyl-L-alanyl-D-glutamate--2,6-diaminopimelate ligase
MTRMDDVLAALRAANQLITAPAGHLPVSQITDDSRVVAPGTLFCAVEGTVADGHEFVPDAARRGAVAAVVTHPVPVTLPQIVVRDSRAAVAVIASTWFGSPANDMTLVGVTGTNGKSTTVALVRHLLNADGHAAAIGTLGAVDGDGQTLETLGNLTTPGVIGLQATLAALRERGVTRAALEASSHALDQRRLETLTFAAAVYTNLSHEHLDYHPSLEAYRDAKASLSDLLAVEGVEVVNADDPAWTALPPRHAIRRVSFGHGTGSVVRATDFTLDASGARGSFVFDGDVQLVRIPLLGDFNVINALGAAAVAWSFGYDPAMIADRLASVPQVAGRLEKLADRGYVVLRDYAHTPDALERAIAALRPITTGRLIVLFGAGGDRDRTKRPLMGEAAARGADLAIVTSDNPRTEDPERIIDEIEVGMGAAPHVRMADRREAIEHALTVVQPGDCLLLAGKGHETYQVVGTERRPFDERVIVAEILGRGDEP